MRRALLVLAAAAGCASGSAGDAPVAEEARAPTAEVSEPSAAPASSPAAEAPEPPPPQDAEPPPPRELPEDYLTFDGACDEGDVVTIAAIGDLLIHRELQRQAYKAPNRYLVLWASIVDLLSQADVTYANLEGPTAFGITRSGELVDDPGLKFDNNVYSGYARFNYHPSLAADLIKTGVDIVSTANNHSLDRDALGVDRTLDALDKAGLKHTGTRRKGTKDRWYTVTKTKRLQIAWVSCTLHTNFGKDEFDQVFDCFDKGDGVRKLVKQLAKSPKIDAVIVTPHWGKEYANEPRERQLKYAQKWLDAGAVAILGSHPHVLERMEKRVAADGREGFVIYSLGNFASHQRTLNRRSTVVLYLGLRKRADGVVVPVGARYVPLHVRMQGEKEAFFVEAIDRVGGPADARAHVVRILGGRNLMQPDEDLAVNPHCDPAWAFPDERGNVR